MTRTMHNLLAIAIACLLQAALSAQGANTPSQFSTEHQAAAELLRSEKWDEAAHAYRQIIAKSGRDSLTPNAQYGLFLALDSAGQREAALAELQALEQLVRQLKDEGALSGQHPVEAWLYCIRSAAGRMYEQAKQFGEAAQAYQKAATAMGTRPQMADWRARAHINAAGSLHSNKQTKQAIELLQGHLPELKCPEFAGMRALVTAELAKLHLAQGDRDVAAALLDGLQADPQIDDNQAAAAEALAGERAPPRPDSMGRHLRTRRGPDYLAIESLGRFEIRIALEDVGRNLFGDNRYGWITAWYNLQDDPFKTRNLASLSYFPLLKPHHLTWLEKRDGRWQRIDPQRLKKYGKTLDVALGMQKGPGPRQHGNVIFEVLEDTPTRVRTRTTHDRWPFESFEYTFYPTGQIFVAARFDIEHDDPPLRIGSVSFYTVKNAQFNWRDATDSTSRMAGEGGSQFLTTYLLSHNNRVPSFHLSMPDDILTCASSPHDSRTFINNEIPLMWRRAPLRFVVDDALAEKSFALQMRVFPRNIDSFDAGLPYVEDYQQPARLSVEAGTSVPNDPGDLNGDGYNESQGCFVVQADGGRLKATLDATKRPCFQPALKVVGWKGDIPPAIRINGKAAEEQVNFSLAGREDALVIQVLQTFSDEEVLVEIDPAP